MHTECAVHEVYTPHPGAPKHRYMHEYLRVCTCLCEGTCVSLCAQVICGCLHLTCVEGMCAYAPR